MFKKITSPLLVFVVLLNAMIAYQAVEERSLNAPPQATAAFRIMDWSGERRGTDIRDAIATLADESGVQVAQIVQDPADPRASRILYSGSSVNSGTTPSGFNMLDIPPEFGRLMSTELVVDAAPAPLSPIGEWSGWGPVSAFQNFIERLSAEGITAEIIGNPTQLPTISSLPPSLLQVFACLVLLVIGIGVARVISAQRTLAVQQLHGATFTAKLWGMLDALAAVFAATMAIVGVLEVLFCFVLYDGAYISEFVGQTFLLAGLLFVFLVAGMSLATFLYHQIDPLPALQGATPGRSLLLTSWLLHGLLLIVVASLGATALSASHQFDSFSTYADQIKDENLSTVQFGGVYTQEQESEVGPIAGAWITDLDQRGDGLVAHHVALMNGPRTIDLLYVNDAYLERNPGQLPLATENTNSVHVYRPSHISNEELTGALEDVAFQSDSPEDSIIVHDVDSTGTYPTYSMPSAGGSSAVTSVSDPVLAVLPPGSIAATGFALSGDGFYVTDGDRALADAAENPGLNRYLRSVTPLSAITNQTIASTSADLAAAVSAFVAGIIALIIVTMTGVISYGQYARKRLKIQYLFGWRLSSMYLWFIVLEALALAALAVWLFNEWSAFRAEQESYLLVGLQGSGTPFFAGIAALVVLASSVILFTLSTAFVHHRMVKKGATQ